MNSRYFLARRLLGPHLYTKCWKLKRDGRRRPGWPDLYHGKGYIFNDNEEFDYDLWTCDDVNECKEGFDECSSGGFFF